MVTTDTKRSVLMMQCVLKPDPVSLFGSRIAVVHRSGKK